MLLLQMLKEMRKAGSWDDDEQRKAAATAPRRCSRRSTWSWPVTWRRRRGSGSASSCWRRSSGCSRNGRTRRWPRSWRLGPGEAIPIVGSPKQDPPLEMPGAEVTSEFGWRAIRLTARRSFIAGSISARPMGRTSRRPVPARVVSAGTQGGYGQTVVVEHAGGFRTRYAHLSTTLVAPGDDVRAGQVVGRAGHSGRATGTHLHFEVTTASGEPLNPEQFAGLKAEGLVADFTAATNSVLQETRR